MIRGALYLTAFAIGFVLYAAFFVGLVLSLWAAVHFVEWQPLAKLPWWAIRLAVAVAAFNGARFAAEEGGK